MMITRKELDKLIANAKKEAVDEVKWWVDDLIWKVNHLTLELQKAEVHKEKAQMHEAAYLNTKSALDQFQFFADETNKATIQKDKAIDKLVTALIGTIEISNKVVQYFIDKDTPVVIENRTEPVEPVNESGKTLAEHLAEHGKETQADSQ